ncbi:glycosyl transferase [Alphaproteobacteria bacterium]|jgi:glucosyl-3-phosphoglycerate synthase|nr:glycosyl transferase [Alphaproteobacteria bacterium]MDB2683935.1 glycosyl transferase [Alphaproteobacteria bacterium]MDC0970088.1 glycosyl transferase [Alphaproteobacteria bacterium]
MGSFYQNGIVANLHDFSYGTSAYDNYQKLEKDLIEFSNTNPMELILPCLFSEINGKALPKIIDEINKIKFLNHIVIGLDRANREEYIKAFNFFKKLKTPFSILWNDGPRLMELDKELSEKGLAPGEFGKGRNVWYCIGMTLARGKAESIALHDCDILTYEKSMLAKLFYPVANPFFNFQFCKGYYPRVADGKMNGRVSRLLVFPLLLAMEKTIGRSEYLDFMKSFRYPLAGEFSFRKSLLPELRIPSDWGLEIGVLSEMQRNHSSNKICQVDLAQTYDHKHQDLSEHNDDAGLSRMSIDITKALIRKLATQGNIFSLETFRSIKATYYRAALDMIDIYRSDARMNGLSFDSHLEEKAVELFALNIMKAGESFFENPMETPFIPTWNRVLSAIPDFLDRFKTSVELDNAELTR